jgi:hypothetical protein
VHADGEFEPLKTLIESMPSGLMVNLASSNEHVPEIERRIRVAKEPRCRATRHSLPFERIPKLLTIHIVFHAFKLLNYFPTKGGVSDTLSPKQSYLARHSTLRSICASRSDSTVKCTRKIPRATVNGPERSSQERILTTIEPPSETTLNLDDGDDAADDADIPGVDDAAIPGVDNVELPGVEMGIGMKSMPKITLRLRISTPQPIHPSLRGRQWIMRLLQ